MGRPMDPGADWLGDKPDLDPVDRIRTRRLVLGRMFGGDQAPILIGRYRLVGLIGHGAMGRVYLGRDPWLSRLVALKFVSLSPTATARIQREAQLLARLNHPNVVAVFDTGEMEGQHFLAMEYVEGLDLGKWLATEARSGAQIVDAFRQAARGIAAAHELGVVHRDIKPENMLCGSDGRVRIADFGLASTNPSGRAGTPIYFAPELRAGANADPRSDQYAFFASLQEALEMRGDRDAPLPRWLKSAMRRGLSPDPGLRFDSMRAAERALRPQTRARGWLAAGLTVAAVAGAGATGEPDCPPQDPDVIGAAWRTDLPKTFRTRLGQPGEDAAHSTLDELDRLAVVWNETGDAACHAGRSVAVQACLSRWRAEMADTVQALLDAEAPALRDAPLAVRALEDPRECLQSETEAVPPPDVAASLSRSRALAHAGHYVKAWRALAGVDADALPPGVAASVLYERGRALAGFGESRRAIETHALAVGAASEAGNDRLAFRAATELAYALGYEEARVDEARRWLDSAEASLARLGEPVRLRANLHVTAGIVDFADGRYRDALQHYEEARTAFESLEGTELDIADTWAKTATAHIELGQNDEALDALSRAEALRVAIFGPEHLMVAETVANHGILLNRLGRTDEAIEALLRGGDVFRKVLGPEHSTVLAVEHNLGTMYEELERYDEALAHHLRAESIARVALPEDHPQIATVLDGQATALRHLDQRDRARALMTEALRIRESVLGPDHVDLAYSHANLGNLDLDAGDRASARKHYRIAVDLFERHLGPDASPTTTARKSLTAAGG